MNKMLFLSIFLLYCLSCSSHPSEATLQKTFHDNREDFERLLRMTNEDVGIRRFTKDIVFYDDDKEISEERANEYRQILDKLRIEHGFSIYDSKSVAFIASSGNKYIFDRSYKAFLYSTGQQTPIVDSIDKFVTYGKRDPVYMKLSDNWYLMYEAW